MEEYPADIFADQRKANLGLIEEQEGATQRKAGGGVARTCLIFREAAVRGSAAAEKALRQRNGVHGSPVLWKA